LIELAEGFKLVFLFPCLMTVDNEQYYLSTAKIREVDAEPLPYLGLSD
jgi:hypothetical protein